MHRLVWDVDETTQIELEKRRRELDDHIAREHIKRCEEYLDDLSRHDPPPSVSFGFDMAPPREHHNQGYFRLKASDYPRV